MTQRRGCARDLCLTSILTAYAEGVKVRPSVAVMGSSWAAIFHIRIPGPYTAFCSATQRERHLTSTTSTRLSIDLEKLEYALFKVSTDEKGDDYGFLSSHIIIT